MSIGGINGLLAYSNALETIGGTSAQRRATGSVTSHARGDHATVAETGTRLAESDSSRPNPRASTSNVTGNNEAEAQELERLEARDREVRAHEQAHKAAAGRHARGGASFSYTRGPDGRSYATGGSVSIDTSKIAGDPEATLSKMQQVQRAALAPADPSSQDSRVAADAAQKASEARREIAKERLEGDSVGPHDAPHAAAVGQPEAEDDKTVRRTALAYLRQDLSHENGVRLDLRA